MENLSIELIAVDGKPEALSVGTEESIRLVLRTFKGRHSCLRKSYRYEFSNTKERRILDKELEDNATAKLLQLCS